MRKTVQVKMFNPQGRLQAAMPVEFDSEFNRPRTTYMPDAERVVRESLKKARKGGRGRVTGLVKALRENPGAYLLIEDKYGYPILITPEDTNP